MQPCDPSRRGYFVCGERRSGSSFLVRALMSTDVLGYPFEYFSRGACLREMFTDPARGLASLLRHGATPNGVYGAKLFSDQFDLLAPAGWIAQLPGLHFVHLERADLLGQAISLLRATQSLQFMSTEPAAAPARYDARAIARLIRALAANQARWHSYFARNGIVPLRLTYEAVAADPQAAASALGRLLDLDEEPRVDLTRVRPAIQRDAVTQEWRERFLAEAGNLSRLDEAPGRDLRQPFRWLRARLSSRPRRDERGWSMGEPERRGADAD
jgi:trehalose 2-sulfotransferase